MKSIVCCAILLAACRATFAGTGCCDHCGCQASCRKVCRVVREVKNVPKTTYDCECEEFCVPGPSVCSTVCDECGHKRRVYTPTCGKLRTRTKLVKHETFEEKVVYKWVVENICCSCAEKTGAAQAQRAAFHAPLAHREPPVREPDEPRAPGEPEFDIRRLWQPQVGRP